MEKRWCWKCKAEVALLDEEEYFEMGRLYAHGLHGMGTAAKRFAPLLQYYKRFNGEFMGNPDMVMHHRLSLYGPDCVSCGKPYRSPEAVACAECGSERHVQGKPENLGGDDSEG